MNEDLSDPNSAFPTTQWTSLLNPISQRSSQSEEAVENICRIYWVSVNTYLTRRGVQYHEAEDITQDFLCALLRRNAFASLRREHGRFRSFLIASLKHFLANRSKTNNAQKRGGGAIHQPFDDVIENTIAGPVCAEIEFNRGWALSLLQVALHQLDAEYSAERKFEMFLELKAFLPGGHPNGPRPDVASRLGLSANTLDVAIHRLRKRYGVVLRHLVAQTVDRPEDVEPELQELIAAMGPSPSS